MKKILSLKRRRYLTRIGVFLIAMALIVGLISCEGGCPGDGDGVVRYTLTMTENPLAGGTATDLTGGSPYLAGTIVNIQAVANPGYLFANWSAPAGAFGNATAATTTFTMPAQNVTVTANFALTPAGLLNHGLGYLVTGGAQYIGENVTLEDRFGVVNATVEYPVAFGNPVEKWHNAEYTPIVDPDRHGLSYSISCEGEPGEWLVVFENQFGIQELIVSGPGALTTPVQKVAPFYHDPPVGQDHWLGYDVIAGESVNQTVDLSDEFGNYTGVLVLQPFHFGNPVRKIHDGNVTEILYPDLCGVLYVVASGPPAPVQVQVVDQFGNQTLDLGGPEVASFVVPSRILYYAPVQHFKGYDLQCCPYSPGAFVYLEDQFGVFNGTVSYPWQFCNPAEKWHDGNVTPILNPDHHFTVYGLFNASPITWWNVVVDGQFGTHNLTVFGPVGLAVPTQKVAPGSHDPPVGLDHYLLWAIDNKPNLNMTVNLTDQFGDQEVEVMIGLYFANPVRKTHGANVTEIENPYAHLLFCEISGSPFGPPGVQIDNQFGNQTLNISIPDNLVVPYLKLHHEPVP